MTQLPQIDPYAWLQYQAQLQAMQSQQAARADRRQASGDRETMQLLMQLLQQGQQQQYEARKANEDRYLDILEGRTGTRNRVLGDVNAFGDSLLDDVENTRKRREGQTTADLSRLGFLGSPSMKQAARVQNDKAYREDLTRAKDSLLSQRIGADERLSNQISDFMERRTDSYPNTSPINSLAGTLGQLGVGNSLAGGRPLGGVSGGTNYTTRGATRGPVSRPAPGPANAPSPYTSIFQSPYRPRTGTSFHSGALLLPPAPTVSPQTAARPSLPNNAAYDPAEMQRKAIRMGADPFTSNPHTLVFNPQAGTQNSFGDPGAFATTQVVQGWQQAGNAVPGVAQFAGQPGMYGTDPYLSALLGSLLGGGGYQPRPDRSTSSNVRPSVTRPQRKPMTNHIISTPEYGPPPSYMPQRPQYALV